MSPIIIPQKLQVVKIRTETEEQTKLRERQVMSNYKYEIEKLKLLTGSHLEKYKSADENMFSLIERKCRGQTQEQLKKLWSEEIKQNENISHRILERKNIPFLESYEKEFAEKYQTTNPYLKDYEPRKDNAGRQQRTPAGHIESLRAQPSPRTHLSPLETNSQRKSYADAAGPRYGSRNNRQNYNYDQREGNYNNYNEENRYAEGAGPQYGGRNNHQHYNNNEREGNYNHNEETTYIGRNVHRNTRDNRQQQLITSDRDDTEQMQTRNTDNTFLWRGRGRGRARPRY